jgi:hypothetical protein
MLGSTECIVSTGPGVQIQWSEVDDGSINLSIQLIASLDRNQKPRRKNPLVHHSEQRENENRTVHFQFVPCADEQEDQNDDQSQEIPREVDQSDSDNQRETEKDDDQMEDGQTEKDDDQIEDDQTEKNDDQMEDKQSDSDDRREHETNDNRSRRKIHDTQFDRRQPEDDNSITADKSLPCEACQKIREKLDRKFETRKHQARLQDYLNKDCPSEFFGNVTYISSEQWSLMKMIAYKKGLCRERFIFHRVHLADCLKQRKERSQFPDLASKIMLQESYPEFDKLDRKSKGPIYRAFERGIEQGDALILISTGNDGLLVTVGGLLSREEYFIHAQF